MNDVFSTHTSIYRFLDGLFDEIVADWFAQQSSLYSAAADSSIVQAKFFGVQLYVPNRFIATLGTPFPAYDVVDAVTTRIQLGNIPVHITDVQVNCTISVDFNLSMFRPIHLIKMGFRFFSSMS